MKILQGEPMCHADGRTDMKQIVAFRNSVNAPKNQKDTFTFHLM